MNLEHKLCKPEQAKRLKQLGINVATSYHWHFFKDVERWNLLSWRTTDKQQNSIWAYDVAELGVMLPEQCSSWRYDSSNATVGGWCAIGDENNHANREFLASTQAEALANLLIWLLESGELTAEECNERLLNS